MLRDKKGGKALLQLFVQNVKMIITKNTLNTALGTFSPQHFMPLEKSTYLLNITDMIMHG